MPVSFSATRWCALLLTGAVFLPTGAHAQSGFARERSSGLIAGQEVMQRNDADAALGRTVRSMISILLVDAQKLIAANDLKAARAKLTTAQLVPDRSGYENHVIARAKLALAAAGEEVNEVAALYEATAQGAWYNTEDKAAALQTVAGVFYNAAQYPQAVIWYDRYADLGGTDPMTGQLRGQAYYLSGDYAGAAKVLEAEVDRAAKSGVAPSEILLKLLASASAKVSDAVRFDKAATLLAKYYPNKAN